MSDDGSQWTHETLKAYILAIIDANDRRYRELSEADKIAIMAALAAADRATAKQEAAANNRFIDLNELRGMVTDQQANFIQRREEEAHIAALSERMAAMQAAIDDKFEAQRVAYTNGIARNSDETATIQATLATLAGRDTGTHNTWGEVGIIIGLIIGILGFLSRFIK